MTGNCRLLRNLEDEPGWIQMSVEDCKELGLKEGEIVTYTGDKYDQKTVSKSKGGDYVGLPLVVIVDGGSASAAEVVTGA